MKRNEEFHHVKQQLIPKVQQMSYRLRHQRNFKRIKKEAMKNMIEGPSAFSHMLNPLPKKDSILSSKSKGSVVGGKYLSDDEENKKNMSVESEQHQA